MEGLSQNNKPSGGAESGSTTAIADDLNVSPPRTTTNPLSPPEPQFDHTVELRSGRTRSSDSGASSRNSLDRWLQDVPNVEGSPTSSIRLPIRSAIGGHYIQAPDPTLASRFPSLTTIIGVKNVEVLARDQALRLKVAASLQDVDGAVLAGSNDLLHDGEDGLFCRACQFLVFSRTNEAARFDVSSWPDYKASATGHGQLEDCALLAEKLSKEYKIQVTAEDVVDAVMFMFAQDKEFYLKKDTESGKSEGVCLIAKVDKMLAREQAAGIPVSLCTCTDEDTVRFFLREFEIDDLTRTGVFQARKKLRNGTYTGASFEKAAELTGQSLDGCVVIGDSPSDLLAAAKARGPHGERVRVVVLRVETESEKFKADGVIQILQTIKKAQEKDPTLQDIQVFIVPCYQQLEFERITDGSAASAEIKYIEPSYAEVEEDFARRTSKRLDAAA